MHHNLSEPAKKKPVNEQNLLERYPNAIFSFTPPLHLLYLTLNQLIERIPKDKELSSEDDDESSAILLSIGTVRNSEQLPCDFLIEAAKDNHPTLVEWLLNHHCVKVNKDFIGKYINSIIINYGSPISGLDLGNRNTLELILCAQDAPTELLEIISDNTNRINSFRHVNPCITELILDTYSAHYIFGYLEKACGRRLGMPFNIDDKSRKDYIDKAIDNFKFLCEIIENYFPTSKGFFLQETTMLFCKYKNIICQYHPQITQELPLLFNSAQSPVEQEKDNATMTPKPQ